MSGAPGAARYRISVKQELHGAAGTYLRANVRVGDHLDVAAPRGGFTLRDGQNPILLVSAGIGATPVLAMLHALAAARSTREVWWLHGARPLAPAPEPSRDRRCQEISRPPPACVAAAATQGG
jgi:ferredoxin-NADP reductase